MTKVALDYETKSSYSVAVDAKDASITTSITVTINVTDVAVEDTPITDNVAPAFDSENRRPLNRRKPQRLAEPSAPR